MNTNKNKNKNRFSIEDAFEEEPDELLDSSPPQPHPHSQPPPHLLHPPAYRSYKCAEDTTSRDSDSLIHDYLPVNRDEEAYCWRHPKVRENWRTVLAAVFLLVLGIVLFAMGGLAVAAPNNSVQGVVFLITGLICFVPGAYHVVYICLAASGQQGYDFYHLPLFT